MEQMNAYVVDDEPVVQMTLGQLLESENYPVFTFGSAEDFCARAEMDEPHLLIVDKNLPGISGLELVLQQKQAGIDFEAILITGYADLDSAIKAVRLGFYSYIRKPFDFQKLLRDVSGAKKRLRQRLEKRSQASTNTIPERLFEPVTSAEIHLNSVVKALQDVRLAPPTRENLEYAYERLRSVKSFLEQRQVYERLHGSLQELNLERVGLHSLLNSVIQELGDLSTKARIPLWIEAQSELEISTDLELLRQLLKNLITIALEIGTAGHPIVVELSKEDDLTILHMVLMNNKENGNEHEDIDLCYRIACSLQAELTITPYLEDMGFEYTLILPNT